MSTRAGTFTDTKGEVEGELTFVVLVVLALIWGAVLIPPMIRNRVENNAADSIGDFRHRLGVLQKATPVVVQPAYRLQGTTRSASAPAPKLTFEQMARRRETQRRRRDILVSLGGAAIASLLMGVLLGMSSFLLLHLLFDALFAGYCYLLVQMRNQEVERRNKLRFLPQSAGMPSDEGLGEVFAPHSVAR